MPFITKYFVQIALEKDGEPVQMRVEFFKHSDHSHLLTIPKANVPLSGIIKTYDMDRTLPAESFYALGFDDDGNSQMEGLTKLSIQTEEVWVDQELLFDVEYGPGLPTYERTTLTPLSLVNKPVESQFVNGELVSFNTTTPTIGDYGLNVHSQIQDFDRNIYSNVFNCSVIEGLKSSLKLSSIRENGDGLHRVTNNSCLISDSITAFGAVLYHTQKYIKNVGSTKIRLFAQNNLGTTIVDVIIDFVSKTITPATGKESLLRNPAINIDQRFPDFLLIMISYSIPQNSTAVVEYIDLLDSSGNSSYAGNTNNGIDIWNISGGQVYGNCLPIEPTSSMALYPRTTEAYSYDATKLNSKLGQYIDEISSNVIPIMYDIKFQVLFNKGKVSLNNFLSSLVLFDGTQKDIKTTGIAGEKDNCDVLYTLNYSCFDIFRIRFFAEANDKIPQEVKDRYNFNSLPACAGKCLGFIENLTKGNHALVFDNYLRTITMLYKGRFNLGYLQDQNNSITGSINIIHCKIWDKPLPSDWLLL